MIDHVFPSSSPDEVLIHPVICCEHCHHDLRAQKASIPERRQVIDLPAKRVWVTEHRVEEKQCPLCYHLTRAPFPAAVSAPAQYGIGIQTVAAYLVEGQSVPYARASHLLQEWLGVQLSAGSIATFVTTCHQQLAEVESRFEAALVKTKVIHQDETGLRVGKTGWWVYVCSTARLTHYAAQKSRGRKALDAIGIAPQFRGKSRHDGLLSYQGYAFTQAWCNVHHLRDMVMLILEPSGLHYDVEMKEIAAITPRPVFLPVLRLLEGVVEYEEATGTLVTRRWQQRNRRASDYLQAYQRDGQTYIANLE